MFSSSQMFSQGFLSSILLPFLWTGLMNAVPAAEPMSSPAPWRIAFAERVYTAWAGGTPMPQLSAAHGEATLADGYVVQKAFVARSMGTAIGGFKAAVVGKGGQDGLKISGPLTGVVPASGVLSFADNIVVDLSEDASRHIETEIGYVFGKPVTTALGSVAELRACVRAVCGVVEVPGGPVKDTQPGTAADLVARNINAKAIIAGPEHAPASVNPDAIQITLKRGEETRNTAVGEQAYGGQWATLLKTVNSVLQQGYTLKPGHIITNGALGKIIKAEPGQYRADYGALGVIAFEVR
jgi:2-oxo-hept-3-ene-1,7-dioate hydratase